MLVTQLCLTFCDPMDCRPPGSSVHEILQARILELDEGLPLPSPGHLLDPRIEPGSPTLWTDSLLSEPPGKPFKCLVSTNFSASGFRDSQEQ